MNRATKSFISNLKEQKRKNKSLLFLDNVKIIADAIKNKTVKIDFVLTSLDELPFETDCEVFKVDERTIEQLSNTKTPQKVVCVARFNDEVLKRPTTNFLVLDNLQDPGNVGTLIRSAFASGFDDVFLVDGVRKESDKLIRSSVGAVFSSNVHQLTKADFVEFVKKHDLKLIACDMNGENIFDFATKEQVGVIVGNEGNGVSEELSKLAYKTVKIPMKSGIESLNAGVSGSIIMYEINKNKF